MSSEIVHRILARLQTEPLPETEGDLATDLGVSRQTINKHIRELVANGVIHGRSPARVKNLIAPPQAIVLVKLLNSDAVLAEIEELLTADERVSFFYATTSDTIDYVVLLKISISDGRYQKFIHDLHAFRVKTETLPVAGKEQKETLL